MRLVDLFQRSLLAAAIATTGAAHAQDIKLGFNGDLFWRKSGANWPSAAAWPVPPTVFDPTAPPPAPPAPPLHARRHP